MTSKKGFGFFRRRTASDQELDAAPRQTSQRSMDSHFSQRSQDSMDASVSSIPGFVQRLTSGRRSRSRSRVDGGGGGSRDVSVDRSVSSAASSSGNSSQSGDGMGDDDDALKIVLGMKKVLRRSPKKKAIFVTVFLNEKHNVFEIPLRASETLYRVRQKIGKDSHRKVPIAFRFRRNDGYAVEFASESSTRLESCLQDNHINVYNAKGMHLLQKGFAFSQIQMGKIPEKAGDIIRSVIRILEIFENSKRTAEIDLPDLLPVMRLFVRDVGRACFDLDQRNNRLRFHSINHDLTRLQKKLQIYVERPNFPALMSYRADLESLGDHIGSIQKEFTARTKVPDDHPMFHVCVQKPVFETEALLNTIETTDFMDLCGELHGETRQSIATFLNMSEMDVINAVKSKGALSLFDANDRRSGMRSSLVKQKSYDSVVDDERMRQLLAPHYQSQESLISAKANAMNPKTMHWAMVEFDDWINNDNEYRCFLFAGGAASGKSTFACHLARQRPDTIVATHYCRHDDTLSMNPKVMMLSVSYQLCLQSIEFENHIRDLLVKKQLSRPQLLGREYPIASLFQEFLEAPLREFVPDNDTTPCILIDGLELCSEAGSDKNEMIKAMRNYLRYLPQWIKLVACTRPHLTILKRLRCFNAKLVEPKTDDTAEDMKQYFMDFLTQGFFGDPHARAELATQLAQSAGKDWVLAKLLSQKARAAEDADDIGVLERCMNLDFDQVLVKELRVVEEVNAALFWKVVRMSLVSARALSISDIVVLSDCSSIELDDLLEVAVSFFTLTDNSSIVRFHQKNVKNWLLDYLLSTLNDTSFADNSSSRRGRYQDIFESQLKMSHVIVECQKLLAQQLIHLAEVSRKGVQFKFPNQSVGEYIRHNFIRHCVAAGLKDEGRNMILDPAWLMEKSDDAVGIIEDCDLLAEGDQVIQLIQRAVELSVPAIRQDRRQIAGQLIGRLRAAATERHGCETVQEQICAFIDLLENHDYGFQWWLPVAATWDQAEQTLEKTITGHDQQIQGLSLHPCYDKMFATASWDKTLRVWDAVTGFCDGIFLHDDAVWSVHWSPAGDKLVSGCADHLVRIYDFPPTPKSALVLHGHSDTVFTAKFSPDGTLVASGAKDWSIRIWSLEKSGECIQDVTIPDCFVYSLDWKPDSGNRYLCSGGSDNLVRVWDLLSSTVVLTCRGHQDWVRSVTWSTNGRSIYSGSTDQTIICWDGNNGNCDQVLMGHTGGVWDVAQSKDGRFLVSSAVDSTIKVWECSSWRCDQTLEGHTGSVTAIAISSDGSAVLSGATDSTIIEWNCEVNRTGGQVDDHSRPVWGIDITYNGSSILTASADHTARLWNVRSGIAERVFSGHSGPVWKAKFSHGGQWIATASSDNTAAIYRVATGGRLLELAHGEAVWDIVWSTDDKKLYTASRDHIIRRWDTTTGVCEMQFKGHTKDVKALAISRDGRRLASASTDISVRIWNLGTNQCVKALRRKEAGATCVDWSPDGIHLVAGYTSGCVRLWNADTGNRIVGFLPGHKQRTIAVSFSPDGTKIASASTDKEIRIWNVMMESCERRIGTDLGFAVFSVKFLDNNHIVSGTADRTVRIWDSNEGRCETVLAGVTGLGIYHVAFSPDGSMVASGSLDRTVQLWDADTGKCFRTLWGHTNWVHTVDWEVGGKRVISRSDDGTSRIWSVQSGECERIVEGGVIPHDFVVGSASSITANLSGADENDETVGIQCDKVKICGKRACGWIGKSVFFFRLKKSHDFHQSKCLELVLTDLRKQKHREKKAGKAEKKSKKSKKSAKKAKKAARRARKEAKKEGNAEEQAREPTDIGQTYATSLNDSTYEQSLATLGGSSSTSSFDISCESSLESSFESSFESSACANDDGALGSSAQQQL